ncbi:hypothetical protein GEV33_004068 [Tenebrio molitor]|uniref:Uncharacterized protein n=1 Tax=Tenebrio molitor TaxID=7067 RepID=A0A8J6LGN2_TENMO|nr:hypothetical protein GEV33_004068 [Tenebrio molitor]
MQVLLQQFYGMYCNLKRQSRSGKTLLLKVIMKEHHSVEGEVTVNGSISYASQEPWLFPSTIKQNILFGEDYDEERYLKVLNLCALFEDLQCFDEGDNTIVMDRGNNLSGGQQNRINLARAIYRDSDIYLLDDCLSSLDVLVANSIFEKCVKTFLKDKLVLMVSKNQKHIDASDTVIVVSNGSTVLRRTIPKQEKSNFGRAFDGTVPNWGACQDGGDDSDNASENDALIAKGDCAQKIYQEKKALARVKLGTYKKYSGHGGGIIMISLTCVLFIGAQLSKTSVHKLEAKWINIEHNLLNYTHHNMTNSEKFENINQKRHLMIYIFPVVLMSTAILTILRAIAFFLMAKKASYSIHKLVATKVIDAPMPFFDNHFVGNILNRFSEDLLYVDEKVSISLFNVIESFVQAVGITILIATVNMKLILPSVVFCMVMATTTYIYLRTGRALKQLEISTRSPFVGHMNATFEGLPTVRASNAERVLCDEFDRHLDLYTSASYMYICCTHANGFVVHIFSTVFIAIVIVVLLLFGDETSVGNIGLVISQSFMLVQVQELGFRRWAKLETEMTAVNRLLEYTKQKQELKNGILVESWPKTGDIRFEKMEFSYKNDAKFVLNDINFSIISGEKIGVIGRTGAGKTSLFSTLLRLYKPQGKIYFDDVDIATLPLNLVRKNISIVPQNPFLFTGTIRENIDPLGRYADEQVWNIIKTINLENLFCNLEHKISSDDCSLSMGQKQLICLGRAVIESNKLVILDEVTANVDSEIETKIQEIIKTHFSRSTVIMITHKLDFIKDCDKVMVLDKGNIVEFDSPQVLLQNDKGMLHKMYTVHRM